MADGLELKRIVDLVTQTDIDEGVYTIIDSVSGAVKKYPLGSFICSVAPIFDATAAYAAGAYCNYNGQLYQFDEAHAAGAWTGEDATAVTLSQILGENGEDISDLQGDVSSLQTDITGKADANGNYPNMTAGNADQLVSSVKIEDQVPYQFRTSGGSADIGDREYDKIVGGTIAWNQLITSQETANTGLHNGITFTNETNYIHVSGTATNKVADVYFNRSGLGDTIGGHIFMLFGCPSGGSSSTYYNEPLVGSGADWTYGSPKDTGNGCVFVAKKTDGTNANIYGIRFVVENGTTVDVNTNAFLIDLTQMFGSTIADYIYSLEQATAGAGVAWFKKLFPKPYYAYDAGTLKSVEGLDSHDMTGFNQWDEEWEVGGIDASTGANAPDNASIRAKNYIPVFPSTTYYCKAPTSYTTGRVAYYDANKNYLGAYPAGWGNLNNNTTFTTKANAFYMRFTFVASTYSHDICINLHWDGERDGEYEPYELNSYPLDDSLTLRGIPKLDASNNLYYDGDTYEADGTLTRRYGEKILNGTESWAIAPQDVNAYFLYDIGGEYSTSKLPIIASNFNTLEGSASASAAPNNTIWLQYGQIHIKVGEDIAPSGISQEGIAELKSWLSTHNIDVVYPLRTYTTEEAEPFQNPQIVNDWGTEEYVTESIVPVGHDTLYQPNLRAKLEMSPNSPDGDGDYIVRQTDGINEYVELVIPSELPAAPTTDGNYKLRVSVSGGAATYSWVADS